MARHSSTTSSWSYYVQSQAVRNVVEVSLENGGKKDSWEFCEELLFVHAKITEGYLSSRKAGERNHGDKRTQCLKS